MKEGRIAGSSKSAANSKAKDTRMKIQLVTNEESVTRRDVPSTGQIQAVAHELWEARGCPEGSPEVDWFEAERQLSGVDLPADDPQITP